MGVGGMTMTVVRIIGLQLPMGWRVHFRQIVEGTCDLALSNDWRSLPDLEPQMRQKAVWRKIGHRAKIERNWIIWGECTRLRRETSGGL
jgi:hypothetical protein